MRQHSGGDTKVRGHCAHTGGRELLGVLLQSLFRSSKSSQTSCNDAAYPKCLHTVPPSPVDEENIQVVASPIHSGERGAARARRKITGLHRNNTSHRHYFDSLLYEALTPYIRLAVHCEFLCTEPDDRCPLLWQPRGRFSKKNCGVPMLRWLWHSHSTEVRDAGMSSSSAMHT